MDLRRRLLSTVCSGICESLAAVRIADFLNKILHDIGEQFGPTGCVVTIDTGQQCTLAGCGEMYDEFKRSGIIKNYTGHEEGPVDFYDRKSFHNAPCYTMKFDTSYYKMPYDCCTREFNVPNNFFAN